MNHVERFRAVMDFQPVDRLPHIEWAAWWHLTTERWRTEGLPEELQGAPAIREYLGLDLYQQMWIAPPTPRAPSHGAPVIQSVADYERLRPEVFAKPTLNLERLQAWAGPHAAGKMVVWMSLDGFFWFPRKLFGIENHMMAFYDEPELMHRMNQDLLEFNLEVIEQFCSVLEPEFMTVAEDMSYNHGPMLSKSCFDEFLAPYYKQLIPALKKHNITPLVDSDGDVMPLIPWLQEVGVEGILPLERMAGVDVAAIREEHPNWKMIGAFDKTVVKDGEEAMRREFERLLPTMRIGGFIPSVDHQTPPDVSLDTYRIYMSLLKEYAQKAALATCCS